MPAFTSTILWSTPRNSAIPGHTCHRPPRMFNRNRVKESLSDGSDNRTLFQNSFSKKCLRASHNKPKFSRSFVGRWRNTFLRISSGNSGKKGDVLFLVSRIGVALLFGCRLICLKASVSEVKTVTVAWSESSAIVFRSSQFCDEFLRIFAVGIRIRLIGCEFVLLTLPHICVFDGNLKNSVK